MRSVKLSISLNEQFEPYILRWLAETDTKTLTWVRNAINLDSFRPEDELDNEDKYTSSIRDLVDSCKGALQFVTDLDWPDEYQNAMFFTRLAAVSHGWHPLYLQSSEVAFSNTKDAS